MRDIKSIKPSLGFQESSKNTSVAIKMNESASTRKSEREKTARVRYEPTFLTPDDGDDMTNLDPDIQSHDQLMSCLEQNVKTESGQLKNNEEDEILRNLLDIGSPDPKSQAAINMS